MPSVVSANRLSDGAVVYLADDGTWGGSLAAAKLFAAKPEVEVGLEAARRAVESNHILDPLVVDVSDAPAGRHPMTLRNVIRADGPTVDYAAAPTAARS
jgi:hypothetical protein